MSPLGFALTNTAADFDMSSFMGDGNRLGLGVLGVGVLMLQEGSEAEGRGLRSDATETVLKES